MSCSLNQRDCCSDVVRERELDNIHTSTMKDIDRSINRRRPSANWSSLNPEERSILTANQLNAQNLKVKKGLEVINKGLEDEKRCEKVARAKEEIVLQNRLNRLYKASEKTARLTKASCLNMETTKNFLESPISGREVGKRASEPLHKTAAREEKIAQWKLKPWVSDVDGRQTATSSSSDHRASVSGDRRKVRFGGNKSGGTDDHGVLLPQYDSLRRSSVNSQRSIVSSMLSHSQINRIRSSSDFYLSEEGSLKPSKLPSCLDYYNAPVSSKIICPPSKGFSHNTASFSNVASQRNSLNQLSGLKDEMHRWKRLSTTRATNARLKAVRVIGRRHASTLSLKDAMDDNARMRKDLAFRSQDFTPARAWKMLNCRYLRLTENNIKTLEELCGDAGYDVSTHPHAKEESADVILKNTKKEHVPSASLLPDENPITT